MSESKEKPKLESHETSDTVQVTAEPESIKPKRPTTLEKSHQSTLSVISTDEEEVDDQILIDDGIPSEIPLEILAGPALILPESIPDIDGRTLNDEFDWAGGDDDDDDVDKKDGDKKRGALANSGVIICLSQNSSYIAWSCIFLFALILIAVDVAIFVIYHDRDQTSLVSYNLQLWFTWLAFMWTIGLMSQVVVEVVPWAIKKLVGYLRPQSTEVLRMRLSYYMALRLYVKLIALAAWAWGSWAFIKDHVPLPVVGVDSQGKDQYAEMPSYISVFFSIWECCFFAALFLFIEKFILQLIVTSFHKKAYGDRIKVNDRALRVLDRLKKMKKKNPQEFLLKRMRRKNKNGNTTTGTNTATPSRSHSIDENSPEIGQFYANNNATNTIPASIMSGNADMKGNVRFPTQNMDTLIAIPPLEDRVRSDDEKEVHGSPDSEKQDMDIEEKANFSPEENAQKPGFMGKFTNKLRKRSSETPETPETPSSGDNVRPVSREGTWFSRNSHDEKTFLGATREFGLSTKAIPGKLLKGGYRKIVHHQPGNKQAKIAQSSTHQAKVLAKRIYHNLIGPDSTREYVVEYDLHPFFNTRKEAAAAFELFDTDGNGDISKRELRSGCIRIYRERKNLARSMRDLSQATGKLDILLMTVFIVVWAIIVCAAFGVNVGTDLMPLWSAFVAASFIFGTSARDAFEAIIFVFVTHPFDSGDRVFIGGENWIVHNVGLLVTTFLKWDGSVVYAKNSVLSTQYIINCRRTGRTGQSMDLQISFSTPSWKIKKLSEHMTEWCNLYPKMYTTNSASANVVSFQHQNMIALSFYFEHTQNWQDSTGRWLRHNNFMLELKEECERLDISYTLPVQPISESRPNDAPPEAYNMGEKASYGLEGLVRRRPFQDNTKESYQPNTSAMSVSHSAPNAANSDNSGAQAGAAATMMFAESM